MRLHFEKLCMYDRKSEPCTVGIPFAKGTLKDVSQISISDGENDVLSQSKITSKWDDGSIKWALVNFLADLPGNKAKDYYCNLENRVKENDILKKNENIVTIVKAENVVIDTGVLSLKLGNVNEKIFKSIISSGAVYEEGQIVGPIIEDNNNQAWTTYVGENSWEIIEDGPVRSIVETKGKHKNQSNDEFMNYTIRIYAYAGKPWIKLDYQIMNCENEEYQDIKSIEIKINNKNSNLDGIETALATSNYQSEIRTGKKDDKLYHLIDAEQLIYEANEHMPETFYGTFFADFNDKTTGGICATIFQAHQNFPKAMQVDKNGINIKILPEESDGLRIYQGMAKTHKVFLHFHDANEDITDLNVRSLQFQMPDRPVLDTEVYKEANVCENIFVENKINSVENYFVGKMDGRGKAYGILNWGDMPDAGYTSQGRGNGEPVWTNNEYDFPHAAMLMYIRTRERRMLDYMLVTAEHWMDVDICHYSEDPIRIHAQVEHSAHHTSGVVTPSHEWVEGLFDYYHMTGEREAYDTAINLGKSILRQLEQPKFHKKGGINARETGWALRALIALYKETNDEGWLKPADWIVSHFEAWKEEYGEWLAPYTDHVAIRVPFMISIAACSLMRYYRVRPQEKLKKMILDAVDDMIENCMLETGLFYYKELPSLRRLGNNTILLEALSSAYELTGNVSYLKYGIETFKRETKGTISNIGGKGKIKVKDAVILQGPGTKGIAQSFYPVVSYYLSCTKEGILTE
jgi:hypothetical protein